MTGESVTAAGTELLGTIGGWVETFAPVMMIGVALAILAGIGLMIVKAIQSQ